MFIKASSFKKMIKQAAGSSFGLHLKNDGENIWLTAPRWMIWIPKNKIPNQQLGDLIALCGWLPESGEAVEVRSSGMQQSKMYETITESAVDRFRKSTTKYHVTRCTIYDNGWTRILQAEDYEHLKPVLVDEDLFGMINKGEIDTNAGETLPVGPLVNIRNLYETGICWKNNSMALVIVPHVPNIMGREIEHMNSIRMLRWDEERLDYTAER